MFFIRLFLVNICKKIWGSPCSFKRKGAFISLSNLVKFLSFVRALAHVLALMTRKSCAVGMRNAILRNYLKKSDLNFVTLRLCTLFILFVFLF